MHDDPHLRQTLDSLRGEQDLREPETAALGDRLRTDGELAEVWRRSRAWDSAAAAALRQGPAPPAALLDRLLAQAREPSAAPAESVVATAVEPPAEGVAPDVVASPARPSRRRWLMAAAGVAGVGIAATLLGLALFRPAAPTGESVLQEAQLALDQVYRDELQGQAAWQTRESAPLEAYPLDAALRGSLRQWRPAKLSFDRQAVVYDLTPPGQRRVWLVVGRAAAPCAGLPTSPPLRPQIDTGDFPFAAWQRGDVVYVLAYEGTRQRYPAVIRLVTPV